jgi:hypothetical protein
MTIADTLINTDYVTACRLLVALSPVFRLHKLLGPNLIPAHIKHLSYTSCSLLNIFNGDFGTLPSARNVVKVLESVSSGMG